MIRADKLSSAAGWLSLAGLLVAWPLAVATVAAFMLANSSRLDQLDWAHDTRPIYAWFAVAAVRAVASSAVVGGWRRARGVLAGCSAVSIAWFRGLADTEAQGLAVVSFHLGVIVLLAAATWFEWRGGGGRVDFRAA